MFCTGWELHGCRVQILLVHAAGEPDLVEAGVVGPLGRILEELSRGGGAKGINIDQVGMQDAPGLHLQARRL